MVTPSKRAQFGAQARGCQKGKPPVWNRRFPAKPPNPGVPRPCLFGRLLRPRLPLLEVAVLITLGAPSWVRHEVVDAPTGACGEEDGDVQHQHLTQNIQPLYNYDPLNHPKFTLIFNHYITMIPWG